MKKSKWPDFVLTIIFRFIGGAILGCGIGLFLVWRGLLRGFARHHVRSILILLALFGVIGGIVGACSTPYWQRPWYKGLDGTARKRGK